MNNTQEVINRLVEVDEALRAGGTEPRDLREIAKRLTFFLGGTPLLVQSHLILETEEPVASRQAEPLRIGYFSDIRVQPALADNGIISLPLLEFQKIHAQQMFWAGVYGLELTAYSTGAN